MRFKHYLILYLAAVSFYTVMGLAQKTPGYMDASYYYVTGQQLATGKGAIEPFVWNYLNDPQQIPAPAFTYWMPLPALLSALGMWLFHSTSFFAARSLFILLAAFIPVLTVYFTTNFTSNRIYLVLAALFTFLCGSYLPYLTTTETFLPFFLLGALYLLLARDIFQRLEKAIDGKWLFTALGVVAGLMHLTRADGILWFLGGLAILLFSVKSNKRTIWLNSALFTLGYLAVMSGWLIRNTILFGSPFPPGSSLAVWFTGYNDLFLYPSSELTPVHLISAGIGKILKARAVVGFLNLENLVGVVGNVVLLPFMIIGLWKTRKARLTQFVVLMITLLFCLMTIVFPYAGFRGGFFHSMSAFQIFLWAAAITGLDVVVHWTVAKLKWVETKSRVLLTIALTLGIAAMSTVAYIQKIGLDGQWNLQYAQFSAIDQRIRTISGINNYSVMINDSPSYYAATGRTAIQLSSGSPKDVLALMKKFNVGYLVVNEDCPESIESLVDAPGDQYGFKLIDQDVSGYFIYAKE
jgi:4-amino-4-deoxy-L-arabinose transferase-like glycosyltransferase